MVFCKKNISVAASGGESVRVIAIDGMGGDFAPASVMKGIARFQSSGHHFIIFGQADRLAEYQSLIPPSVSYEIRHADDVVTTEMGVLKAIRVGKSSSMGSAIQAVKSGEAAAVISSGNTGAYMALSKVMLKTIDGIDRPAITSILPGKDGRSVCLDLGANAECTVKNLVDFAILGEALAASAFNRNDISIGLMNIGSEEIKGSNLVKNTSEILRKLFDNYVGFVEGNDLCNGAVDVIIMDGFTGNVALKAVEGAAKYIVHALKEALASSVMSKAGAVLASGSLRDLRNKMDPRLHNGAVLAGLNGVVVKSHGNSDEIGFENAIKFTSHILNKNIFARIQERIDRTNLYEIASISSSEGAI